MVKHASLVATFKSMSIGGSVLLQCFALLKPVAYTAQKDQRENYMFTAGDEWSLVCIAAL